MYDASKETNMRFMRAAIEFLQEKNLVLEKQLLEALKLKQADEALCQKLSEELLALKKRFFCTGPERNKNQKKKRRPQVNLCHNQSPIAGEADAQTMQLEQEEVVHQEEQPLCPHDETPMEAMQNGYEESCEIDVVERRYILKRHKRQKYVCPSCRHMHTAKGPVKLSVGGEYALHMGVQVVDDKFNRHLPLERQCAIMKEHGLQVDSKTLYTLTEHVARHLEPITQQIRSEILQQPCVFIDESPMAVHNNYPQKDKEVGITNGYVWSLSNNHGAYYQYEPTRSGGVAKEMLRGYRGIVMTDGYAGYDFLKATEGIKLAHCWAHVRRKFHEAITHDKRAQAVIDFIDKLYAIEHQAADFEQLKQLRNAHSKAIIAQIEEWKTAQAGRYLESSSLGKAINYMNDLWPQLTLFLSEVHAPLDNNMAERTQRRPVMGRKNFYGFKSINGADTAMTLYTIIESCRRLGMTPKAYMVEMIRRAAQSQSTETPYQYAQAITEHAQAQVKETLAQVPYE